MIPQFFVLGSSDVRPASARTIFADGSADATYREGVDLELSHWIPNRTPERYKANTSTEICMNFVAEHATDGWELAINNHLDCDGVLSIFTLVHPQFALQHRETIIQIAEMGDFMGWGDRQAQVAYQELTRFMFGAKKDKVDIRNIYADSFDLLIRLLETDLQADPRAQEVYAVVDRSLAWVESGQVQREVLGQHFVHYHLPATVVNGAYEQALHIPAFNALLTDDVLLLPQVRHKLDPDKVHLVSVEAPDGGTYYDLWYPGYMWAETPHAWRAPGFAFSGSTNGHYYGHPPLERVVRKLQELETADGEWMLVKELSPFSSIKGRNFPVVLSFLQPSQLPVHLVASMLAQAF
ncbi:DUF6687 family protein [Tumebacillus permanentifrigoris]|uniref:Uncharacterized protein n=1 Tax=Tumebacillus permanentifrigoris TaxID=378543 RepID=A0A316DF68_9BACL|nr:DUF6687 family protein [Tumebacillus permanentifrigoris]PWK14884.1 hypothetical protein C7459_10486 [Tumebacillus permanentifrigoris]